MNKMILMTAISLLSLSAFAGNKQVVAVATVCDCFERTIDGEHKLGKAGNATPASTQAEALRLAKKECKGKDTNRGDEFIAQIRNCVFSKAVEERIGKRVKTRIERMSGDDEDNLSNDLISTL